MIEPIADADGLYRRLAPHCVKRDGTVTSSAFMTNNYPDDEISLHLARLISPQDALRVAERPHFGIGSITAAVPRRLDFEVLHDPRPTDESHALARGKNTKEKCRLLANAMQIVIRPASVQQ